MPDIDTVLTDLHVTLWREQMAQRERAELAEARVEELERRLSEAAEREARPAEGAEDG